MVILDVVTGKSTEIHTYMEINKKLNIPAGCSYELFIGKVSHYRGRYINIENISNTFLIKDIKTNEEFRCVTNKTMEYHLGKKFNQTQLRGINHLKNHSSYSARLDDRVFILVNGDKNKMKERGKNRYQQWKKNHPTETIDKHKTDINFRMKRILRNRVYWAMRGKKKSSKTMELLGCDIEFFKKHMENLFEDGMNWSNHGRGGWHVDHIMPCSSFDLTIPEQQKACFHYTNLQPLWQTDNLTKHDKLPHEYVRLKTQNLTKIAANAVVTD